MADRFWKRILRKSDDRALVRPLYAAIIHTARAPHWYQLGKVEDSVNGRFEMVTVVFALVTFRLEEIGEAARKATVLLAECYVEDMDGQLREMGVSDVVMGKRMGKLMSGLGGRLGVYREGFATGKELDDALIRNLYRGEMPPPDALAHVRSGLIALRDTLASSPLERLLLGQL